MRGSMFWADVGVRRCGVSCIRELRKLGHQTIVLNCNPETVRTTQTHSTCICTTTAETLLCLTRVFRRRSTQPSVDRAGTESMWMLGGCSGEHGLRRVGQALLRRNLLRGCHGHLRGREPARCSPLGWRPGQLTPARNVSLFFASADMQPVLPGLEQHCHAALPAGQYHATRRPPPRAM
eukprot:3908993-Rhodomonas_salina.1